MDTCSLDVLRHELDADRPRHARALMSADARARRSNAGSSACIGGTRSTRSGAGTGTPTPASIGARFGAITATRSRRSSKASSRSSSTRRTTSGRCFGLIRESYGRSQWHVRWGAEEVRHADLWRNAVVALGRRDQRWIEEYASELRRHEWALPWDSPRHIVFYQVIQERATQVSYLNLGLAVDGKVAAAADAGRRRAGDRVPADRGRRSRALRASSSKSRGCFCTTSPKQSLEALVDVLRHFTMPARDDHPELRHLRTRAARFRRLRTHHSLPRRRPRRARHAVGAGAPRAGSRRAPRARDSVHRRRAPNRCVPRHAESAGDRTQGLAAVSPKPVSSGAQRSRSTVRRAMGARLDIR